MELQLLPIFFEFDSSPPKEMVKQPSFHSSSKSHIKETSCSFLWQAPQKEVPPHIFCTDSLFLVRCFLPPFHQEGTSKYTPFQGRNFCWAMGFFVRRNIEPQISRASKPCPCIACRATRSQIVRTTGRCRIKTMPFLPALYQAFPTIGPFQHRGCIGLERTD